MRKQLVSLTAVCTAALGSAAFAGIDVDPSTFGTLRARSLGPAVMGGRVAAIDAVAKDPLTIFVGAASGGVWRSKDAGVTFEPVFDRQIQSIGAIRIDPSDPDVIWVGTGESWVRNSVSVGDGVYKSTDGGDTWQNVGLADSERIARIQVHPADSDTVYVCATGHLWNANDERGVYRTTDGGETWAAVLQVDENTGCSDLTLDPEDPRVLYAGMWDFRRKAWTFRSGGPGSGLYKSTDGGDTWTELTRGLPEGEKGRIAVAVSPARPRTVYAVVEAEETALYRSDDLGQSWRKVSTSANVQGRPFYFAYVVPDPADPMRVYKPGWGLTVSVDGGETFGAVTGGSHSDHHALWINPSNPHEIVLGTDGGVYLSADRGGHFRFSLALPISQYYEVDYDMETPYNVYGGLQDNGTWMGPSRSVGGITAGDWRNIGFGDGFHAHVDPTDPDFVYVEWQGGNVLRMNKTTGEARDVKPLPRADEPDYRFNWNTPIHVSRSRPERVYVGAQFLFRSEDGGASWERISPDLTTDDPEKQRQGESGGLTIDNSTAENHCTIYTISESTRDPAVIWVGTDDGNLQLTRDGGESWSNVVGNVPDLPAHTWVSHVAAGLHADGTAYATFDGHRDGDMKPYVYRTTDWGATWTALGGEEVEGFAQVVAEDPVSPDLLFVGTELGLWISVDGGENWARFEENLPPVPVHDLAIHPREHDLIVATHGRGIYIVDDITPLRHLTSEVVEAEITFLPSRPPVMSAPAAVQRFPGDDEFVGGNPDEAYITFYQKKRHLFGDLKIEIYDGDGELISTLPTTKRRGINRVPWSMRLKPPKMPAATSLVFQPYIFVGPRVEMAPHTVRLIKGKTTLETVMTPLPDPRSGHSPEDRAAQHETAMAIYRDLERLTYLVDALVDLRDQASARAEGLAERSRLRRELRDLGERTERQRGLLVSTNEAGRLSGERRLREELGFLYGGVNGYDGRPTDSQVARHAVLSARLDDAVSDFEGLAPQLERLNSQLERAELEPLTVLSKEAWRAEQEKGGAAVSTAPLSAAAARRLAQRVPDLLPWL